MNSDPGSDSNDRRAVGANDKDSRHAAVLDFLIDQERKLLDAQDARQSSADAKIAASLTVALTLAAVTLTAAAAVGEADAILWIKRTYWAVVLVAVVALAAGLGAGYRRRRSRTGVSTVSGESHSAIEELREFECRVRAKQLEGDAVQARCLALEVWRSKAQDSRHRAQRKEFAAAGAGVVLAVALILSAILVSQIDWVAEQPGSSPTQKSQGAASSS